MAYKHGVYVSEAATSLQAPVSGTAGLQVIVGTAPVNLADDPAGAVNKPKLCYSYKEACAAVGYSDDWEKYTLCQSIYACFQVQNTAPIILINVLDPMKHKKALTEKSCPVISSQCVVGLGILKEGLVLKASGDTLIEGTDYTLHFDDRGQLLADILPDGSAAEAQSLTVSAGYAIDPESVTAADIVGAASGGAETGLQLLRQIYPLFGMTPGLLLAPGWSHYPSVAAAMQAKCENINGVFSCECLIDIASSAGFKEGTADVPSATVYSGVKAAKESLGAVSPHAIACWPMGAIGEKRFYLSALLGALIQQLDAENDDIPCLYPSNKNIGAASVCLADGTEVILDQDQAGAVNSFGVVTMLNMNGMKAWGNNTCAYPGNTDPKDRFIGCRRFFTWAGNSFIMSYFQKVDDPMNKRLIENIVDSANIAGNGYVARGCCAAYRVEYLEDENPTTDILDGKMTFHLYIAPYTPAEDIEAVLEFDTAALTAALQS